MGKTLSIETGIRCSNRCSFCYQLGWRAGEEELVDPTLESLVGKLKWGREHGYDSVGFSGGEPTVRKDFPDLVRKAVELGYGRVSLTTNGRRFADREFAAALLEAGVDSIGWSLHGPDAETHDRLVGRKGAFEQAVQGMKNVGELAADLGRRVDQNLFTLVNRMNHHRLVETCRVGRSLGIRLMILQPVIFAKGNLDHAAALALPLQELLAAVRNVVSAGKGEKWFVKLFNLPPCFFPDSLDGFEHQRYPVDVFRYQEREKAGESRVVPGQGYLRLDRCADCLLDEFCPGLHQSLLPQDEVLKLALQTLDLPPDCREVWVAGTELMQAETLAQFLADIRRRSGTARLKIYFGGDGVAGKGFVPAAVEGGAAEVSLVFKGLGDEVMDVTTWGGSNVQGLMAAGEDPLLKAAGGCLRSVSIPYLDSTRDQLLTRVNKLAATSAGDWLLEIQFPWDFKPPEIWDLIKLWRMARGWRTAGGGKVRIVVPDRGRAGGPLVRLPMSVLLDQATASAHYARHFFSGPLAGWICLSIPAFAHESHHGEELDPASIPVLAGFPGQPITPALFERMRPG